ncbi:MAG: hypothetical protein ACLR5H_12390 [Oscillospiraceae bacterium]
MEYIMLRLRTARGIDIREFENRFRQRFALWRPFWRAAPPTVWPGRRKPAGA